MSEMLCLNHICVSYGSRQVLHGIDLSDVYKRQLLYHAASQQHQLLLPLAQGTEIYICPIGQTETPQYC